jgi:hypothetical protein
MDQKDLKLKVDYAKDVSEIFIDTIYSIARYESKPPKNIIGFSAFLANQMGLHDAATLDLRCHDIQNSLGISVSALSTGSILNHVSEDEILEAKGWDLCQLYADYGTSSYWLPWARFINKCRSGYSFWRSNQHENFSERQLQYGKDNILRPDACIEMVKSHGPDDWEGDLMSPNRKEYPDRFFIARKGGWTSAMGLRMGSGIDMIGISEFPVMKGDEIRQFRGSQTAFIARPRHQGYCIVSRAYIGRLRKDEDKTDPITSQECTWRCLEWDASIGSGMEIELDAALLLLFSS